MKYQELLNLSKKRIGTQFPPTTLIFSPKLFHFGCRWMYKKLNETTLTDQQFNYSINYGAYGILKYSLASLAFFVSLWQLSKISLFITPLSIILFYLIEIHFLFLFPLLLDRVKNPLWVSIRQTYKTGILTALLTTIPIGFFMLSGVFNIKNPLRNWYIGCFAIIIWYQNEVRNRV